MDLGSELEASLREFSAGGPAEVRDNGVRVAPLSSLSWEVRGSAEKPLLHLWSENHNLTRRVLAIAEESETRLALLVERFGRSKPDRLEFLRLEYEKSPRDLEHEAFCQHLAAVCAEQFPDDALESLTNAPDLEHSLSGSYARGVLRRGKLCWALLAMPPGEPSVPPYHALTFALIWRRRLRHSERAGQVAGLRLVVPKGAGAGIARLLPAMDPALSIALYEWDAGRNVFEQVDPQALANLDSWLVPARETQLLLDRARPALAAILERASSPVEIQPVASAREVWLRFRGLPFARWEDGRVFFGVPSQDREFLMSSRADLERMLRQLESHRHPLAPDTRHPLYRAVPERWLESLVREDVTQIDAALDPRFAYTQVFANAAGEHGILDVLCVTRLGRVAILELKASEHIHFPLQAAGYWLRIRRHLEQGDLQKYGYFPGAALQSQPPIVYLVAPALRFHPTTDILVRRLHPDLEVVRVGLAEHWRRGLRVVLRQ